jgi:prepilin-type N-terminal cleavage/methylation domain-containing protein
MGRKRERGITLPELLVVLAIIGLFALIAIPAFRDFLNAFRVKTAAMQVRDTTRLARQMAVARKTTTMTQLTTTAGSEGYFAWEDENDNQTFDAASEEIVRPLVVIPEGVTVLRATSNQHQSQLSSPVKLEISSDGTIGRVGAGPGESQWCYILEKKVNHRRTDRWMITFKLSGKSELTFNPDDPTGNSVCSN